MRTFLVHTLLAVLLLGCCLPFGSSPSGGASPAVSPVAVASPPAAALNNPPAKPTLPGQQPPGTALTPTGTGAIPTAPPTIQIPPGADPRAAERMTAYAYEKMAQGYLPHGAPGADRLSRGQSRGYSAMLQAGDCYTIAAFGGSGVRDLDIYLTSPSGRELARDVARDSRPIANTCVQETGTYGVRILMYEGNGPYTYQIYRNPGAAAQAQGVAQLDPSVRRRMDQFSGRYVARGFRPVAGLAGSGVLASNQSEEVTVDIRNPGSCYAFVGFAGSGMSDLDIYLSDANGNALRRDVAVDPVADVKHFIVMPGLYHMRLHAYRGAGAYAYQVYERPQRTCE